MVGTATSTERSVGTGCLHVITNFRCYTESTTVHRVKTHCASVAPLEASTSQVEWHHFRLVFLKRSAKHVGKLKPAKYLAPDTKDKHGEHSILYIQ